MIFFICVPVSAGDESQILEIDNVILHPKYDLSNAYQDISVIKLKPNKGKFYINIMSQKHITLPRNELLCQLIGGLR